MSTSPSYEAETEGVIVRVSPQFLDDESSPEDNRFMWAYTVEIENRGSRRLKLITRYWHIADSEGRVQEVRGRGVVGQTPVLEPGDTFEYTSGAPLAAPSGLMSGSYCLADDDGETLDAKIPLFALDSPYDRRSPN